MCGYTLALCDPGFSTCVKSNSQNMSLRKDLPKLTLPLLHLPLDLLEYFNRANLRTSVGYRRLMKYVHLNDHLY